MAIERQQRAQRFPLSLPLRYRIAGQESWTSGKTHNISDSGLLFGTEEALNLGTVIDLEVALETNGEKWPSQVVAQATVVRIVPTPTATNPVVVGAKFLTSEIRARQAVMVRGIS